LEQNGHLDKIKKDITKIYNYSEKLRDKLDKKFNKDDKHLEKIDFETFWKKFDAAFRNDAKAVSFIKILLNVSDQDQKVLRKDAYRLCDWLTGADQLWISEGFKNSHFYEYFVGVNTEPAIKMKYDNFQDDVKSLAILYWDPTKKNKEKTTKGNKATKDKKETKDKSKEKEKETKENEKGAFCVLIRFATTKGKTWDLHILKTKTIGNFELKKEVEETLKVKSKPRLVQSSLFARLKGVAISNVYTKAESTTQDSIYVY